MVPCQESNPQRVVAPQLHSPPFRIPSSSPEPRSPSSGFSPPSSRHVSLTSSPSPTLSQLPTPLHPCLTLRPHNSAHESEDTVLLSSTDESEVELPHPSSNFPPLRRQVAVLATTARGLDSTSSGTSEPHCNDTTSVHQHFQ